ncbi:MAG: hypothetical protein WC943_14790 [Elusimicrobiota bacterium]|jgi:hypothetical protein
MPLGRGNRRGDLGITGLCLLVSLILAACVGDIPRRVTAYGFGRGSMDVPEAREAAGTEALSALSGMLAPSGLEFRYRALGADQALAVRTPDEVPPAEIRLQRLGSGWAAIATGWRQAGEAEAMEGLGFVEAVGESGSRDLRVAHEIARSRALRKVVAPLAEECREEGCAVSGRMTLRRSVPELMPVGLRVTVLASVDVSTTSALTPDDLVKLHRAQVREYASDRDWEQALVSLDAALAAAPRNEALKALRRKVLKELGRPEEPASAPDKPRRRGRSRAH